MTTRKKISYSYLISRALRLDFQPFEGVRFSDPLCVREGTRAHKTAGKLVLVVNRIGS